MKLAEALQERADLSARISILENRLMNNALVQEGEKPAEAPEELIAELDRCSDEMERLITAINLTNSSTVSDGMTVTELIAKKDVLNRKLSIYRHFLMTASQTAQRATRSEIKILSTVNVREYQQKADGLAKRLRILENRIQQINWTTELIEK
ncbi:MAG: DIP1984 family protein [Oscillospiraceae bacterium]|nr:DIP1984 family protein [Oscillospiraceae bacterium]MDD7280210.1 DIP1984 family protein [Oscillospiraceae bacterium]MDY2864050.1 DIP1984 family protein [Oscillospiraceae bacterium]